MSHPQRHASARAAGFTLVELLTVIAIISILAALLFPVFAEAREKARQVSCLSNEKQIGMSVAMYTEDYDETLPLYSFGAGYGGILGYNSLDGPRWADMIFPYVKNTQTFDCPDSGRKMAIFPGGKYFNVKTYSYGITTPLDNTYPDSLFGVAGRALSELDTPAQTVMLADDTGHKEYNALIEVTAADSLEFLATKLDGIRHSDGGDLNNLATEAFNALYSDDHVKYTRLGDTYGSGASLLRPWKIRDN